jgi:hypothetical protein
MNTIINAATAQLQEETGVYMGQPRGGMSCHTNNEIIKNISNDKKIMGPEFD